jgi:hypothetical protein
MSTRAQVRFATRETGQSFSEHPEKIHAQFYCHSDGYPEGLGMDIAESITMNNNPSLNWEIEELQTQHGDLDFIYYIWQGYDKDTYISIFEVGWAGDDEYCKTCQQHIGSKLDRCIFVGSPEKLIESYSQTKND